MVQLYNWKDCRTKEGLSKTRGIILMANFKDIKGGDPEGLQNHNKKKPEAKSKPSSEEIEAKMRRIKAKEPNSPSHLKSNSLKVSYPKNQFSYQESMIDP